MTATLAYALAERPVVMDGGLATLLETRGHDLTSAMWSARLLRDDPAQIRAAHLEYFRAGAEVAISSSYQASFEGFAKLGFDRAGVSELMLASVGLAREARDELSGDGKSRWIAASVGPYGATLADGSEYRGDYGLTIDQLREWHRPRLEVLLRAGADVLALETIPSTVEAQALLAEIAGTGHPVWLSLTIAGGHTRTGEPAAEVFELAADVPEVVAVGINCTDPLEVADLVRIASRASGKPVVVYPNSGEVWDGAARAWTGSPHFPDALVGSWVEAGARLIGGCCRVGPAEISRIASAIG